MGHSYSIVSPLHLSACISNGIAIVYYEYTVVMSSMLTTPTTIW
jgi:hypothetical protein